MIREGIKRKSFLIIGPEGSGKKALCRLLAKQLRDASHEGGEDFEVFNFSRGSGQVETIGPELSRKATGPVRLCEKALFPLFVILSVAKNLVFRPLEILRFAQDDTFHTVCCPRGLIKIHYVFIGFFYFLFQSFKNVVKYN